MDRRLTTLVGSSADSVPPEGASPPPPRSTGEAIDVELVSVTWSRIQLVVRLRPVARASLDPDEVALVHTAVPAVVVRATRAYLDGDDVVARFNVMAGPDQRPLDPGVWLLGRADQHGGPTVPLVVADPAGALATPDVGTFRLEWAEYRAVPRLDAASHAFVLEVVVEDLDASRASGPARRAIARARRWVRRGRWREWASSLVLRLVRLLRPRTGHLIVFASYHRAELGGNLKVVHERMLERRLDTTWELQTLLRPGTNGMPFAARVRHLLRLARADIIVIDDFHPIVYRIRDRGTRIVQLWHAVGAFKTVGYSRVGKVGGPDPYSDAHKNYTWAIVSSQHDVPFYAEAFGIGEDQVIPTGIPRVDRFRDPTFQADAVRRSRAAFPESVGRMTILFAPTFRGNGAKWAHYDMGRLDYAVLHRLCVELDAVFIVRMHPFVREPLRIPEPLRDRILDGASADLEVNDILPAVDLLVTDYSSVVFEYSTLLRPMLFYAYDLDEYVASRDFYEPYESFVPGRIVRTFDDLVAAIRSGEFEAEKVAAFASRHFDHVDGAATDRVVDLVVSS